MNKEGRNEKAIMECYRLLYKNSTPSADFDKLIKDAPLNKLGQKSIQFWNYEIDRDVCEKIIKEVADKYKFKGYEKKQFKNSINLGCAPKYKG